MVAVKSIAPTPQGVPPSVPPGTPMGPPMGGMMGPPPAVPAAMPNTSPPGMAPPSSGPQQVSNQGSLYGGSASSRIKFKGALGARKSAFMAKQQLNLPSFGQFSGAPMGGGSMAPLPPLGGSPRSMLASGAPLGRMIGDNASVGSAPVQMMNGGVVPLFNGLGRY